MNIAGAATLSHTPSGESQTTPKPSPTPLALVDDSHRVLVNKLPVGVVPQHMKNKLTLYFQRKTNGGGEVLDVTYPAAQPDQACITFHSPRGEHTDGPRLGLTSNLVRS